MDTKHTPEPWKLWPDRKVSVNGYLMGVIGSSQAPVAYVPIDSPTHEANNALLVTAPRLLAALEAFIGIADAGNATGEEELKVLHAAKIAVYLAKGGEKFARKCSITGAGMNEGWVFESDLEYAATKEASAVLANKLGYKSLADATEGDDASCFWTTWEVDEVNEGWYTADGQFVEPTKA